MAIVVSIFPPSRGDLPPFDTSFALQQDNWNDYSFQTLYHLYRRQLDPAASPTLIGPVKILRRGQTRQDGIQLQQSFERLDDRFCSVGTSLDYYQRLNELPARERDGILEVLRDVVAAPDLQTNFRDEDGWDTSLFRDNPNVDTFLVDARAILTGNYGALADLNLDLSFHSAGWTDPLKLDFDAPTGWSNLNFIPRLAERHIPIPRRIIAVIGRNGSGKSTLLSRIARVAFAAPAERQRADIRAIGVFDPPSIGFTKIIAISYSAFDNFVVPGVYEGELRQIASDMASGSGRYVYVGLRDIVAEVRDDLDLLEKRELPEGEKADISPSDRRPGTKLKSLVQLAEEFERLTAQIAARNDNELFDAALRPLFADPSFAEIDGATRSALLGEDPKAAFLDWSTGHKIALHVVAALVAHATRRSIVLFDEPEMHLHPPLTASLMRSLRIVLEHREALAIVATHSPVVLQETLAHHVRVIRRSGELFDVSPPKMETFGENVGALTYDAFGLTAAATDFHEVLDGLIERHSSVEVIDRFFTPALSGQARAYVMAGLARKIKSS